MGSIGRRSISSHSAVVEDSNPGPLIFCDGGWCQPEESADDAANAMADAGEKVQTGVKIPDPSTVQPGCKLPNCVQ